jgi:hypothetical protein
VLAAGDRFGDAFLYDARTGRQLAELGVDVRRPTSVRFLHDGSLVAVSAAAIMNKVSALALLSNAVLVWNTVRMTEILRALKIASGAPAEVADIGRISPLAHAHVIPSGTYHFERAMADDAATAP